MPPVVLALLVYVIALPLSIAIAVGLYWLLVPLHDRGAVGRWIARCIGCCAGSLFFTFAFLITGSGSVLSKQGVSPSWREGLIEGLMIGVAFATVWPIAQEMHRRGSSPIRPG